MSIGFAGRFVTGHFLLSRKYRSMHGKQKTYLKEKHYPVFLTIKLIFIFARCENKDFSSVFFDF